MPVPSTARPDTFSPVNWSGDVCSQLRELFAVNERLNILFSWMFDDEGNPTTEFLGDLKKWVYGPLTVTGTSGAYVAVSTPPYATINSAALVGRVVYFRANHDSPSGGSTLKLDDLAAAPLTNKFGNPLAEGDLKTGMDVHVIYNGTTWTVLSQLSQLKTYILPGRDYASTSALTTNAGNFPANMSITLTKPSSAKWDHVDLNVHGRMIGSSGNGASLLCALVFDSGALAGSSVDTVTGAGNVSQAHSATFNNDSTAPTWRRVFDVPSGYDASNTITFKATLTSVGIYSGDTDVASHFFGVAHYLSAES